MTDASDLEAWAAERLSQEWHNATFIHPMALVALGILAAWMLLAPRRTAIVPFLILICFIPSAQRIVIADVDFTLLRLMAFVGVVRLIIRREYSGFSFNRIDFTYIAWVVVGSITFVVRRADSSAVMYVLGQSTDMLGAYIVARLLIKDTDDFRYLIRSVALISLPVALLFAYELATQRNLFAFFGGVREITWIRHGRLRCQGAFSHPILAGVFWAAIGALCMGGAIARQPKRYDRVVCLAGTAACIFIIVASASSTPVLGFAAGTLFWLCWPVRRLMRYAFIATPFVLTALHFAMQAPVWHLIARVSAVGGSTGYHRYKLIDNAINRFSEWGLLGTNSTVHWGWGMHDIANQYVFEAVQGGIWRLALFCTLVYFAAKSVAKAQARASGNYDALFMWGFGATLFVHCVCFIGVSYFGQIQYLWYMTIAISASAHSPAFFRQTKYTGKHLPRPAFSHARRHSALSCGTERPA